MFHAAMTTSDWAIGLGLFSAYVALALIFVSVLNRMCAPSQADVDASNDWKAYKEAKAEEGEWAGD